jgi:HlyD family secretion protein
MRTNLENPAVLAPGNGVDTSPRVETKVRESAGQSSNWRKVATLVAWVVAVTLVGWVVKSRLHASTSRSGGLIQAVPLKLADIVSTIEATGTVEPEEVVDVGAQVAGQIISFGNDKNGKPIDYGSSVEAGTVLAQIDDSLYAADFAQANAQLTQTRANLLSAEANVMQMQAKLDQAARDWERAQKLGPSEALAPTTFDAYRAAYETTKANLAAANAAVEQSKAAIAQAEANLKRAQQNVAYCTIKSPVKGVIVDRRVNIGQTVVSSLNAPSLFLIAKDLTRIQVWVSVNEADIGHIKTGAPVTFTVDAFPGRIFRGQVGKVRLNATMTQNVVTYTVEVNTDNADGRLLPYLTASARFETDRRSGVLAAPNAALRWTPSEKQIAPEYRHSENQAGRASSRSASPTAGDAPARATLWLEQDGMVRPVRVTVGLTDGTVTEVQAEELHEGVKVAVADQSAQPKTGVGTGGSPFTPQIGRSRSANPSPAPGGGQSAQPR